MGYDDHLWYTDMQDEWLVLWVADVLRGGSSFPCSQTHLVLSGLTPARNRQYFLGFHSSFKIMHTLRCHIHQQVSQIMAQGHGPPIEDGVVESIDMLEREPWLLGPNSPTSTANTEELADKFIEQRRLGDDDPFFANAKQVGLNLHETALTLISFRLHPAHSVWRRGGHQPL